MTRVSIGSATAGFDYHLVPGQNLYTGAQDFALEFGKLDSLEEDLLNLAVGIYGADLCIARNERELHIRDIELTVEVINHHAFARVKELMEEALLIVSKDNWTINFVAKAGQAVSGFEWKSAKGSVLLFSGGIDSMAAASMMLSQGEPLTLVSHTSQGNHITDKCQRDVLQALKKHYKVEPRHVRIKAFGRNHHGHSFPEERENTQRTRSFMFLSLATIATRKLGLNRVLYMAENGQFAIHLPLNQARVGPFSTHTADPEFVGCMQGLFRTLLTNPDFEIANPFLFLTKAEVVAKMPEALQKAVKVSASCWMISHVPGAKHCGYCIPCITRRIALEYNGVKLKEYHYDLFNQEVSDLADDNDRKRNLVDYLDFIARFKDVGASVEMQIVADFPELINPAFDRKKAIGLYARVSKQSYKVLGHYPKMKKLM